MEKKNKIIMVAAVIVVVIVAAIAAFTLLSPSGFEGNLKSASDSAQARSDLIDEMNNACPDVIWEDGSEAEFKEA